MAAQPEPTLPEVTEVAFEAIKMALALMDPKPTRHRLSQMVHDCAKATNNHTGAAPLTDLPLQYKEAVRRHAPLAEHNWDRALKSAAEAATRRHIRHAEEGPASAAAPLLIKAVNCAIAATAATKGWEHGRQADIDRAIENLAQGTGKPSIGRSLLEAAIIFRDQPTPQSARILLDLADQAAWHWHDETQPGTSQAEPAV